MEDLAIELQKIYDSEIKLRISWLWDGEIDLWLGDDVGGFEATEDVKSVAEIVPWFQEAIVHFYPRSAYAQSLGADVIERAQRRVFRSPQVGARVICPHCGAPNASFPGMTEVIAFVCLHCGMGVKVAPPKVQ
jgi:hypothetical protein